MSRGQIQRPRPVPAVSAAGTGRGAVGYKGGRVSESWARGFPGSLHRAFIASGSDRDGTPLNRDQVPRAWDNPRARGTAATAGRLQRSWSQRSSRKSFPVAVPRYRFQHPPRRAASSGWAPAGGRGLARFRSDHADRADADVGVCRQDRVPCHGRSHVHAWLDGRGPCGVVGACGAYSPPVKDDISYYIVQPRAGKGTLSSVDARVPVSYPSVTSYTNSYTYKLRAGSGGEPSYRSGPAAPGLVVKAGQERAPVQHVEAEATG